MIIKNKATDLLMPVVSIILLLAVATTAGCAGGDPPAIDLIPKPAKMEISKGYFAASLEDVDGNSPKITYTLDRNFDNPKPESYKLTVTRKGAEVTAGDSAGLFYGRQTLRQLVTPRGIPCVRIEDEPRFPHRGFLIDVSRNFFSKEFLKKVIDRMGAYKLNKLQLHLTDAQGWRFQIDKYPELTRLTAFRNAPDNLSWTGRDRRFVPEGEPGGYGGYYTKDDIREIVAYAASKHITVIPEIEIPGHSAEVFVAYPELSCFGRPYVDYEFCIGNEQSYVFLENVLTEVMELFPSEYIHIGGDEAGHWAWEACPKCQALMKKEKLANTSQLQSHMIRRIEEFLNSHGRKIIGWDEILEGGLPPRATVMSWRGEEGGIKSARMGHDVIMAPTSYLYFDYYQSDPTTQPRSIGGYVTLKRVYSFDPIPSDSITSAQARHILGAQGNLWAEFISEEAHSEYMMFPRALALAEMVWTPQEMRSWDDFKPRANAHIRLLQEQGLNPFTLSDEIEMEMEVDIAKQEITVHMDTEKYPAEIRYTTDGATPTETSPVYGKPVTVKDSVRIRAAVFRDGAIQPTVTKKDADYHRGIGKPIVYRSELNEAYMAGGTNALIDGYRGGKTHLIGKTSLDGRWQGYTDSLDCVVDMEEATTINKVSARFMQPVDQGISLPGEVELLTSEDGENFVSRGVIPASVPDTIGTFASRQYDFRGNWPARYVRLKAGKVDDGQLIFTDEIVIW